MTDGEGGTVVTCFVCVALSQSALVPSGPGFSINLPAFEASENLGSEELVLIDTINQVSPLSSNTGLGGTNVIITKVNAKLRQADALMGFTPPTGSWTFWRPNHISEPS